MLRRFELAGNGTAAVRMSEFLWRWWAGQPGAEEARLAWVSSLRDEFEDCRACTVGNQTTYLVETGRHDEADPVRPRSPRRPLSGPMRLAAEIDRLEAELSAMRARLAELEATAERDALTGVLNRRGFERELVRAIAYLDRYRRPG